MRGLPRHIVATLCVVCLLTSLLSTLTHDALPCLSYVHAAAAADPPAAAALTASSSAPITETELIAVDLGHDNMKISAWRVREEDVFTRAGGAGTVTTTTTAVTAAVSIVLNDQTNRKSPPCVAFRYFKAPAGTEEGNASTACDPSREAQPGCPVGPLHPPGYMLERTFAEQAQALAPRFPTHVVCSPAQLLGYTAAATATTDLDDNKKGVTPSSPYALTAEQMAAQYHYPVQTAPPPPAHGSAAEALPARRALGVFVSFPREAAGTVAAQHSDGSFFTAEELTAMLLGYARRMAEKADAADNALSEEDERQLQALVNSTGSPRPYRWPLNAALTIPVHATVAQRQALVDAAALAGLRVLRLVHSTTGSAVQLAYMKTEQVFVPGKTHYVMLYDMGSQQAEVAVYAFTAVPPQAAKATKASYAGAIELIALVGSRSLGGAAFDACIAAQWDALYFRQSILSGGVGNATVAMAKQRGALLRAARKAKETLSVNQEAHVTLDGVHAEAGLFSSEAQAQLQRRVVAVTPDGVLSLRYSRASFEQTCAHLFTEAVALRDAAIRATNGRVGDVAALDRFELVGGGTRVPLLIQRLSAGYRPGDAAVVDRTLNGDEAPVLGATLLAVSSPLSAEAQLRGTQSVPRFRVREWLTNTIYISFSSAAQAEEEEEEVRLLFPSRTTTVPATRSVRLAWPLRSAGQEEAMAAAGAAGGAAADVTMPGDDMPDAMDVTLYSGADLDAAYAHRAAALAAGRGEDGVAPFTAVRVPTAAAVCRSCYARRTRLLGLHAARQSLLRQAQQRHPTRVVTLRRAEVVAEATVTESGIPRVSVAYLRAELEVSLAAANASAGAVAAQETETVEKEKEAEAGNVDGAEAPQEEEGEEGEEGGPTPHQQPDDKEAPLTQETNRLSVTVEVKVVALEQGSQGPVRRRATPLSPPPSTAASPPPAAAADADYVSYNAAPAELALSYYQLRRLQAIDDVRLHRSTLRNDVESVLLWVREHPLWDTEAEGRAPVEGLPEGWRETVKAAGEWLDDYGETAGVAALEERLATVRGIKKVLRDLHDK